MQLVAREKEFRELERLFGRGARLVTLTGVGGVGKTVLAREYLRHAPIAQRAFCSLAGCVTREDLCQVVATSVFGGVRWRRIEDRPRRLGALMNTRGPSLVVLDEAEPFIDLVGELVAGWLDQSDQVRFLVTSRERLLLSEEASLEMLPLSTRHLDGPSDAARLFIERARSSRRDYEEGQDLALIERIVEVLEGIPLAIELAAGRMSVLSPQHIAERLTDRFELLVGSHRDGSARHQTLRRTLDWSWDLLDEAERATLAQLSVFRGGFSLEAAEQIVDLSTHAIPVARALESLRNKSLLIVGQDGEGSPLRFDIYETIRVYSAGKLPFGAELVSVEARHGAYYVGVASSLAAELRGQDADLARRRLDKERGNLFSVCRRIHHPVLAHRALLEVDACLLSMDEPLSQLDLFDAVLDAGDGAVDPLLAARVRLARAKVRDRSGQTAGAEEDCRAALATAEAHGDLPLRIAALTSLITIQYMRGDLSEALTTGERAVPLTAGRAGTGLEANLHTEYAVVLHLRGRLADALVWYESALSIWKSAADQEGEGRALACLGCLYQDRGDLPAARRAYERAQAIFAALRNDGTLGIVLGYLGNLERRYGNVQAAQSQYRAALDLLRRFGDRQFEAVVLIDQGLLYFEHRRYQEGQVCLLQALTVLAEAPNRQCEALARGGLGACYASCDRVAEAAILFDQAETLTMPGDPFYAPLRVMRGHLDLAMWCQEKASAARDRASSFLATVRARLPAATDPAPSSDYAVIACRALLHAIHRVAPPASALRIAEDGTWFAIGGRRIDLRRRAALGRILRALSERGRFQPGVPVAPGELLDVGWPGERVEREAGRNRVRVALATLRTLGLRGVLRTDRSGYFVAPEVPVAVVPGDLIVG